MRTTLTLDPDVAIRVKAAVHRQRASFKEVVNAAIRRGIGSSAAHGKPKAFRVELFRSPFRAGVDPARLNQILDDLEARDFRARASRPCRAR